MASLFCFGEKCRVSKEFISYIYLHFSRLFVPADKLLLYLNKYSLKEFYVFHVFGTCIDFFFFWVVVIIWDSGLCGRVHRAMFTCSI